MAARAGGRKAHRFDSSAVVPARQPVRAAAPIGVEVAVLIDHFGAIHD